MKLFDAIFGPNVWETKYYALLDEYAKLAKQIEDMKASKPVKTKSTAKTSKGVKNAKKSTR